jgi:hypothetical protein
MDSESRVKDTGEHIPYLIESCWLDARYNKENWKEYQAPDLALFWRQAAYFGGIGKTVNIYAHNMGYDLIVTGGIPALLGEGFKVTSFFEKGTTFILTLRQTETYMVKRGKDKGKEKTKVLKTINLISTTNYFTVPLAKLGEIFNLPKLDFDFNNGDIEQAKIYCRRDVEIMKIATETFIDYIQTDDLGTLAKTTPGQAFNAYRHRFTPAEISLHDSEESAALERYCYYGGRVECFKVGEFTGKFFGLDINSMYPAVMLKNKYPVKLLSYRCRNTLQEIEEFINRGLGICGRFIVKTDRPLLPARLQDNLIFPVGTFETYLSTPEIIMSLQRGLLIDVKEISIFQMEEIFRDYVTYFYEKRQAAKAQGNKVYDLLFKLFLNSLYGKFGQKSDTWERSGDADPALVKVEEVYNKEEEKIITYKTFGGSIFKSGNEQEAFNSFCAIAAHVTAYARQELLYFMEAAGWENVYYTDTDSIFTNEKGYNNLAPALSETDLGKLKLEKEGKYLKIYAPKDYDFDGKITMKGVKKGGKLLSAPGEARPVFAQEFWPRLNTSIRQGTLDTYKTEKREKTLSREYNKGWVISGGAVLPLTLDYMLESNILLPFDPDSGWLQDPAQEAAIQKKYKKVYTFPPEQEYLKQEQLFTKEESKRFRKALLALGGVKDKDYEYLPRWCKRNKSGRPLDVLAAELREAGYPVNSADDIYNMLQIY